MSPLAAQQRGTSVSASAVEGEHGSVAERRGVHVRAAREVRR
ncbi:MAG: hypothetical protein AB7P08_19160 [Burkholderiales bacterium]